MKALVFLFALFVAITESVLAQPIASVVSADPVLLTCPANPAQLASNIAKQERSNEIARSLGWTWIRSDADLRARVRSGELVAVRRSGVGYRLRIGVRAFANAPSLNFLTTIGEKFAQTHEGKYLEVTSLVRTISQHEWLRRRNLDGASCDTPLRCSTHLYTAIDFSCRFGCDWLRNELYQREARGEVIVIEGKCNPHFHVFVVPSELILATHPQTPAEEENMSPGTQPVAERDGGGR